MATIASAFDTEFTPSAANFIAQAAGGNVSLLRKNSAGAAFALVATVKDRALVIENPVAGAVYKFMPMQASTTGITVQADQ